MTKPIREHKFTNIYQKLNAIQSQIKGLSQDASSGTGKFGYKYVSGNKVLGAIKPLMTEYGLILKTEVVNVDKQRIDYFTTKGEKSEMLYDVDMKFTWVDIDTGDKDENLFHASGMNGWEKGLGSALTYGERYFLLKYFHIATDEDDIDNDLNTREEAVKPKEDSKSWLRLHWSSNPKAVNKALERLKKESIEELTEKEADLLANYIRN